MSKDNNFSIYKLLFNDINVLKERVDKLEKENTEYKNVIENLIPSMIVTDVNYNEDSLKITKYDRKTNKNITESINYPEKENISSDNDNDNNNDNNKCNNKDDKKEEVKNSSSYLSMENAVDKINKILNT